MIDALIVVGVIFVFGILALVSGRFIPSKKKKETSTPPDEIYPLF